MLTFVPQLVHLLDQYNTADVGRDSRVSPLCDVAALEIGVGTDAIPERFAGDPGEPLILQNRTNVGLEYW